MGTQESVTPTERRMVVGVDESDCVMRSLKFELDR